MVKYSEEPLNETFAALADPTRRSILVRLAEGETSTMVLAEPFDVSLPAVMKHLRILEEAGLIIREKEGRVSRYRLNAGPLREAAAWINPYKRFWRIRLNRLEAHLRRRHGRHNP
jgi:DNA-binding transcriptional ArsR family regulator